MINMKPLPGCWVCYQRDEKRDGYITSARHYDVSGLVEVRWRTGDKSQVPAKDLSCGFQPGMEVEHQPVSSHTNSYGIGVVQKTREIANYGQALVEFMATGEKRWLPFERLSQIKNVRQRFLTASDLQEDSAERFRLKFLAHAIDNWNENTGALSRMDIDPLPHQIHLVHHILNHGSRNWLIADDVGLGKTIETGMLIKALEQRGMADRVLLVTPAGLTQQWKEELREKFGLNNFRIYGDNFQIEESREWGMFERVITSIDRIKEEAHLDSLAQAGRWDLVIFDEAHRLSRSQYGNKYEESQRYQLAKMLRKKTDSMIFLSATPHQGKEDKFHALLHLLRPDLQQEIDSLSQNPAVLREMMIRNNKADVTDADGKFVFHGKSTHAIRVDIDEATQEFDQSLQDYLRQGYAQAAAMGSRGNAIGFVMTVYRKLAASSIKAIYNALIKRKERLQGLLEEHYSDNGVEQDSRYAGEQEELALSVNTAEEFFSGEIALLTELIEHCQSLLPDDRKLKQFMESLVGEVLKGNPDEKVLIFSEYRSTQEHLRQALANQFGNDKVELINGSMSTSERKQAIERFESTGQFLLSTEAGGEGINLQKTCHIMVNYDLPWNPMRLVQRIGRLYRYGQKKMVVVFNMHSPTTADEQIIQLMYERIDQVVRDLSTIGDEFNERLSDDILGEVAELSDIESILKEAAGANIERTKGRINDALALAKTASSKQRELFEYATRFDANAMKREFKPSKAHIHSFVRGMFEFLDIELLDTTHNGHVFEIRMPDTLMDELHTRRSRWAITLDRIASSSRADIELLDMDHFLMKHFIEVAKSHGFGGQTAVINHGKTPGGVLVSAYLRWQNEYGKRQHQEFSTWLIDANGSAKSNPDSLSKLTAAPLSSGTYNSTKEQNQTLYQLATKFAQQRLGKTSNQWLMPENIEFVNVGWMEK
jgi:ERCC4-related helicase